MNIPVICNHQAERSKIIKLLCERFSKSGNKKLLIGKLPAFV